MYADNFLIHRIVKHATSFFKKKMYWRLCLFDVYLPHLSAVIPSYSQINKCYKNAKWSGKEVFASNCSFSYVYGIVLTFVNSEQPVKMSIGLSCGKILRSLTKCLQLNILPKSIHFVNVSFFSKTMEHVLQHFKLDKEWLFGSHCEHVWLSVYARKKVIYEKQQ